MGLKRATCVPALTQPAVQLVPPPWVFSKRVSSPLIGEPVGRVESCVCLQGLGPGENPVLVRVKLVQFWVRKLAAYGNVSMPAPCLPGGRF